MIDIHPPEHTPSTWRDFFIHIATIVLGLVIAIGLEQTVEWLHHKHQVRDTRTALRHEREQNHRFVIAEAGSWRVECAMLQNDLLVLRYLQQHPGTPEEKLPGTLVWGQQSAFYTHTAWDAAQQDGIAALMPGDEVANDADLYLSLKDIEAAQDEVWLAVNDAGQYDLTDPDPSHLSPARVAEVFALTEKALMKAYLQGVYLENLSAEFHDFPPSVSTADLGRLRHRSDQQTRELLAPAHALTLKRLEAAGYVPPPSSRDAAASSSPTPRK